MVHRTCPLASCWFTRLYAGKSTLDTKFSLVVKVRVLLSDIDWSRGMRIWVNSKLAILVHLIHINSLLHIE